MKYNIINCTEKDLDELYSNSALTFEGTCTDEENLNWLVNWFEEHNCQMKTDNFYVITGKLMNNYFKLTGKNAYPKNLTILTVKLSDLTNLGGIILPRFEIGGRWFDDVVDNKLAHERGEY